MVEVRRALLAAFEAGRAQWPNVGLSLEEFAQGVQRLEVGDEDLSARGPDLYLAAACTAGHQRAFSYFETAFVSTVDRRVARFRLPPEKLDELRQKLRTKLLMGPSPGIAKYRGRAPLGAWVHVTVVRLAIDFAGAPSPADPNVDIQDFIAPDPTPEVETVRRLYKDHFRAALETAFDALTAREKTILRLRVIDGLSIDAIGVIYAVHRGTVARWLVGIRSKVYDRVKSDLALRWNASTSDLRSLVSLLREEIQITVERVLGTAS